MAVNTTCEPFQLPPILYQGDIFTQIYLERCQFFTTPFEMSLEVPGSPQCPTLGEGIDFEGYVYPPELNWIKSILF